MKASEVDSIESSETQAHDAYGLTLTLTVTDSLVKAALSEFFEGGAREEFALTALRIGVLALKQAQGEVDAAAVRKEGEKLISQLGVALAGHADRLHQQLTSKLTEYFDPHSGRFHERVERLIKRDGELEQVLRRNIGEDGSELCKTLHLHVGQQSPLMKILDPAASDGIAAQLHSVIAEQLQSQRDQVLREFSLDTEDGALCRFLSEIKSHHDEVSGDLTQKIDKAVGEFSTDDENSALSRMLQRVSLAQQTITREFSLDDEKSSLSRLKTELFGVLEKQAKSQQEFQEHVRLSIHEMQVRRDEAARSTRHGDTFEDAVMQFVTSEAKRANDVAHACGDEAGAISRCRIGDVVIELGPECAAPGARIVVEAKESMSYDLKAALEESAKARANREAQVGIFVFSKATADASIESFSRFGSDIVIVWDQDDTASDLVFRMALTLARFMCIRPAVSSAEEAADFEAIEKAILEVEKRSDELEEIKTSSETIQNAANKIQTRQRLIRQSLDSQVVTLRDRINELRQFSDSTAAEK